MHEDNRYIQGLLTNDSVIIREIYKRFVPKIVYYIKNNSGNEDDAQDVIQETLIVIYNQAKTKGLVLSCPFEAYFLLLCKRRWINELKKSSNREVTNQSENVYKDESVLELVDQSEQFEAKQSLFEEMFQKLGEKCQEVLRLSFSLQSMEEVAQKLNVTYAYARKKKSLCTGQLTTMIQESKVYKSLKS